MLNVSNLSAGYGQSVALHGITFSAKKNETVAIMGRNGMGKSTLFKSLIGALPIKSGNIKSITTIYRETKVISVLSAALPMSLKVG